MHSNESKIILLLLIVLKNASFLNKNFSATLCLSVLLFLPKNIPGVPMTSMTLSILACYYAEMKFIFLGVGRGRGSGTKS